MGSMSVTAKQFDVVMRSGCVQCTSSRGADDDIIHLMMNIIIEIGYDHILMAIKTCLW